MKDGNKNMKIAIYPGTFDPITNGHLDIIKKASKMFDKLIIGVANSSGKNPMFTLDQRKSMVQKSTQELSNIEVKSFKNLLVDFAEENNAGYIIRGLRAVSDFEYELQLGYANSSLNKNIETIFLIPNLSNSFVSSTIVRSILEHNGEANHLVPSSILSILGDR